MEAGREGRLCQSQAWKLPNGRVSALILSAEKTANKVPRICIKITCPLVLIGMPNSIRTLALVSFTFLAALLAGCAASAERSRSNDTVQPKPLITPQVTAARPKIVAFGDSLTAGFGLTERESYPYLLQQQLNADGYNYEVVNAGVSGDTSLGGLERIDWVLDDSNVQILVLELGANDLLRGVPPAKMKENLDQIITKAKAKNVKVLLCGMLAPPTMGAEYQRSFTV